MPVFRRIFLLTLIAYYGTVTAAVNDPHDLHVDDVLTRRSSYPASDVPPVEQFPYEIVTLDPQDSDIAAHPELLPMEGSVEGELGTTDSSTQKRSYTCKVIPEDSNWPHPLLWKALEVLTTGGLLKDPTPLAAPCYAGNLYNTTTCAAVTNNWSDSDLHDQHATSIMSPFHEGATCVPTSDPNQGTCSTFGFPNYVVRAKSVLDVQLAVNFARSTNVRLVIKNTGHDFSGKSAGANSLSIWTHYFKNIDYIPCYGRDGYNGPAFKVGAGVQVYELYKAAANKGLMVVGGEGVTVGFGGGYFQGGGHSPLSSILGISADHVLSFQIVTADGHFRYCDSNINSDLFWAVRGGGGSTYGVVTSVVVKAYPTVPVTTVQLEFATSDTVSLDQWWDAVKAYMSTFPTMADNGVYSYFWIFVPGSFTLNPGLFAPNLSAAQVKTLLAPLYDKLNQHNIPFTPVVKEHANFYTAWKYSFPKEQIGGWNSQAGSRLFPRKNWSNSASFDAMFNAIKSSVMNGNIFIGFNLGPTLAKGGNADNAVNTAWRETLFHAIALASWPLGSSAQTIEAVRWNLTNVFMKEWRDASPGAGAYLGESDVNEPNFQQSFWGSSKYPRLYSLKQKFDPTGVFFARTAVGSEDWEIVMPKQRLCRK